MSKYKITSEQIKEAFESPACRFNYTSGSSRCAVGKFIDLCLGSGTAHTITKTQEGTFILPFEVNKLQCELLSHGVSIQYVSDINDAEGHLEDNHRIALRTIIQDATKNGFIEVKDPLASEFTKKLLEVNS